VLQGAAFAVETDEGDEQLVAVHQLDRQYRDADFDEIVRAIRRAIVEQHELDPHAIVLIRQTSLPITSSGKVQRNLCREQYLAGELKIVHSWTNPAPKNAPAKKAAATEKIAGHVDMQIHDEGVSWSQNGWPAEANLTPTIDTQHPASSIQHPARLDQAAERIETWLLEWLMARLGLDTAEISRDRPFAEFGVDSLTAVELSQELEDEFKIPLPPIVAWNYPTPATLARYLAEQSLVRTDTTSQATNGYASSQPTEIKLLHDHADAGHLADLLAEIENLSDEEAARLLADEQLPK
jgi:acyl carrier protein